MKLFEYVFDRIFRWFKTEIHRHGLFFYPKNTSKATDRRQFRVTRQKEIKTPKTKKQLILNTYDEKHLTLH